MTIGAVSDAGPLIHLDEIDSLDLLSTFDPLLIPETVYDEVESGGLPDGLSDHSFEPVVAAENGTESAELDPGERAAFAIAKERDVVLLTDDLAARQAAADADVEVHGSIGVIAFSHARGVLEKSDAASLMRSLHRETSLFVTEAVVERGIRMLDER